MPFDVVKFCKPLCGPHHDETSHRGPTYSGAAKGRP